MLSNAYVNTLLFGVYPYICLVVLLIGSLIRFDREPYTWKSDSSQMLRKGQLRLGSNLFHYGVIIAIIGLTILIYRRLGDPRIRLNSRKWDIVITLMLWLQLALGLLTVPLSAYHMDGVLFETLTSYVKGIVTLDGGAAALMVDVPLTYKLHVLLGFTLFLVSPFTRMIHIWSGAGVLAYLFRPYQIVRTPKTRAKEPVRS